MMGYRKTFIAALISIVSTIVAVTGHLTGEFSSIMIAVMAAFSYANSVEHKSNGANKN